MKISKKVAALAIALALILSFAACAAPAGTQTQESSAATTDTASAETSESASAETSEELPVLLMATNAQFAPYEFYDGDQVVGIDAEIAGLIADKLGMKLQIEDMEFEAVVTSVQSGKVDIGMAALTIKPDRLEAVNFSSIYATGKQVIIVKEGSDIASADDFEGKTIGVQQATTGDSYVTMDYVDTGLANIERYSKGADAVQALVQGKIDAVVIDNAPAEVFVEQNEGLTILPTEYALEDYAIAVSKDNTELLDKINTALDELIASGDVQAIIDKYINAD
jgi:polar amino acid transport system substrate-binding protein